MHPLLDVRPWPRILWQYPLLMLTAILLGAGGTFAYSYAPLHRAKDWQIEYLQGRLDSRTEQVEALEIELRQARGSIEGQPSGDEVKALRAQLDEASALSTSLQGKARDLEGKLAKVTRSRDSWRKKHASAAGEIESMKTSAAAAPDIADAPTEAAPASKPTPAPTDGAAENSQPTPAAPAPDSAPDAPRP